LFRLAARNVVGRSNACNIRMDDPAVSGEHAALWWDGLVWRLRDLASRNGTWIDSAPLPAGQAVALRASSVVSFGQLGNAWRLQSDGPPVARAVPASGGPEVLAVGELLALPDAETPACTVSWEREASRWTLDAPDGTRPVTDGEILRVGESAFLLHLPQLLEETGEAREGTTLDQIALRFSVSRDEEHVEIEVVEAERTRTLGARAFHFPLLCLARARLKDSLDTNLPATSHGWVYQDELLTRLGVDQNKLYVDIYRARRQLAELGIHGAAELVERRASSGQLRIGVSNLEIGIL
jgi:hypothetical protein